MLHKQLLNACGLVISVLPLAGVSFGAGNPILLVGTSSNQFSFYYSEILRAEGFNTFDSVDLTALTASTLNSYDIVILGQASVTPGQVTLLTNWVNGGGNLIAMQPDKQLAPLLGLSDTGTTLSNAYLLVNTTAAPGAGIVAQPIQFHGTADRYVASGATFVATLYSSRTHRHRTRP